MKQFRYVEIHERCCGFSTGQGKRANFECFVVIRHLRDGHSAFLVSDDTFADHLTL